MKKLSERAIADIPIRRFEGVYDTVIMYCGRPKLVFVTADEKTILMIAVDRGRPTPEKDGVEVVDSAWEKSREIIKSGKSVNVENPSANDFAIAHIPLIVRSA